MTASISNGGLPVHAAERMRIVFAAHPDIEQVILFGSRAKGNFKPASDIDLAVTGTTRLGGVDWELDDLLLPWEIDLIPLETITNQDLRDHIQRVGQVFYSRREMAA